MKKTLKNNFITIFALVAALSFSALTAVKNTAKADDITYNSAEFTEDFTSYTDSAEKFIANENVTIENAAITSGTYGRGVVIDDDAVITTNMGVGEFDLYLTLSDNTVEGDNNYRGTRITFANGNDSVYTAYIVKGSAVSVGSWLYKDGTNIAPDWSMMGGAAESCSYKIEVREGSFGIKYLSDREYVYHPGFPCYVESSAISGVSGYITISKCENTTGTFTVNSMRVDPVSEDCEPRTATLDADTVELGSKGNITAEVDLSAGNFVGVCVNGKMIDGSLYKKTVSDGAVTKVAINKEAFAIAYCEDTFVSELTVSVVARDIKYVVALGFTVGNVALDFVDENDNSVYQAEVAVGTVLEDIKNAVTGEWSGFAVRERKKGYDGKTREYLSEMDNGYAFYKETEVYCLTANYEFAVYLYTLDNFSDLSDARKVTIPWGQTVTEYIEQVNSDGNNANDVIIYNPFGKLFTGWDYSEPITEDRDVIAEYYTLKANGKDVAMTFEKEPSAAEMTEVLIGGQTVYDGTLRIKGGHPYDALMSSQRYTDFEYSFDLKGWSGTYTNDWSFSVAFGVPNYDVSVTTARKYALAFKNVYDTETESFTTQMVLFVGGDNTTVWSNYDVAYAALKTDFFNDTARLTGDFVNKTYAVAPFDSGLSEDDYVSVKIYVKDGLLKVYTKRSAEREFIEEFSYQLAIDTTGYVVYYQKMSDYSAYGGEFVFDNMSIINLANELHEITASKSGISYDAIDNAYTHVIGESYGNNDVRFDYNSRFQSFVATAVTVYDKNGNAVRTEEKDISVERINGENLKTVFTFSDDIFAKIYRENERYAYGSEKTLDISVCILTDSDFADVFFKLKPAESYSIYIKNGSESAERELVMSGTGGNVIVASDLQKYFGKYTVAETGKVFSGWQDENTGKIFAKDENIYLYKNMTIVPYFERIVYTVKFADKDGTVYDVKKVMHGDDCELPKFIPESDDGEFIKWADNYKNVTSDRTVLAEFGGGSGCGSMVSGTYAIFMIVLVLALSLTVIAIKNRKKEK